MPEEPALAAEPVPVAEQVLAAELATVVELSAAAEQTPVVERLLCVVLRAWSWPEEQFGPAYLRRCRQSQPSPPATALPVYFDFS